MSGRLRRIDPVTWKCSADVLASGMSFISDLNLQEHPHYQRTLAPAIVAVVFILQAVFEGQVEVVENSFAPSIDLALFRLNCSHSDSLVLQVNPQV